MLYGSAIGDALGGPIEFQSTEAIAQLRPQPKVWQKDELFDAEAAIERLQLRPYAPLRPKSESYGQWGENAPAGTITDDTRHKLILLEALHQSKGAPNKQTLAKVYMDWPSKALSTELAGLNQDWLEEWRYASAWVLGIRDPTIARPPERLWQGLPTCCGQMTSLPLAALYPGKPVNAYRACYELSYLTTVGARTSMQLLSQVCPRRSPGRPGQRSSKAFRKPTPIITATYATPRDRLIIG